MATPLADLLFWLATVGIAIAQLMILRSTRRGMGQRPRGAAWALEWSYALIPALALVAVLALTWRTMHPSVIRFEAPPSAVRRAT
ncbi:MAG TPA: hypothetical protein VJL28_14470 [Gemmatimonadaceae bacterium]|nr:hypothetical protein [Gemmatimonadaceae bacterium]